MAETITIAGGSVNDVDDLSVQAITLKVAGLRPFADKSDVTINANGSVSVSRVRPTKLMCKLAPFVVEAMGLSDYNDIGRNYKLESIHAMEYIWIVGTTLSRDDNSSGNLWSNIFPLLVEPVQIETSENFESGTEEISITYQPRSLLNISELLT